MREISWNNDRMDESVLNEIGADRELVATITKQKLQYFDLMIRAKDLRAQIL